MNRNESARAILLARDGTVKDPGRIRRMFAGISGRYDLLNHLLSLNIDRRWRRTAVGILDPRPGETIVDLCTGTADLALAISRTAPGTAVVGADFCPEMVMIGEGKRRARKAGGVRLAAGDSLRLPFPSETFDGATVAFGIRNLPDLGAGLGEMLRILRPGGRAVILEFTRPPGRSFRALFGLYFRNVLPRIGRWISGATDPDARDAYTYLPASVEEFPDAGALAARMEAAGFDEVRFRRLSMGIACIHSGRRPRR